MAGHSRPQDGVASLAYVPAIYLGTHASNAQTQRCRFIDSNHVVKTGGEVNYIALEILPMLPSGVIVHFHDISLIYEYDREAIQNFIHPNETAILVYRASAAWNLMSGAEQFTS